MAPVKANGAPPQRGARDGSSTRAAPGAHTSPFWFSAQISHSTWWRPSAMYFRVTLPLHVSVSPGTARRRLLQRGMAPDPARVAREAAELAERDRRDRARPVAPLRQAEDAVLLDSTDLEFADQVREIVALVRRRLPQL